ATFTLAGGTLGTATVQSGTTLTEGSNTVSGLTGVTLNGNLNLTGFNAGINVTSGLTLNGLATLRAAAYLNFLGSNQTLGGGGTVTVQPTALTNFGNGTLTGGNWQVHAGSTLRVILATPITTNAANVLLDGAGSNFYRDTATTDALGGLTTNAAAGSLTVQN